MTSVKSLEAEIFTAPDASESLALDVFRFQYRANLVYREFCDRLGRGISRVKVPNDIPFLPASFFKTHRITSFPENREAPLVFRSSGTTGQVRAQHFVHRPELCERAFLEGFRRVYGHPKNYRLLALLPGYSERGDASLVHMVHGLMQASGHPEAGFFLDDRERLRTLLSAHCERTTLLIGVSFALLDLAEAEPMQLKNTIVMETGGMKGKRREITRTELHKRLSTGFGTKEIHSEYGMTELLSQAYAPSGGRFTAPPWMKIGLRDINDPLSPAPKGRTGAVNITDLANLYSCSFIAVDDLGRKHADGSFEILGRTDFSDIRGCNLMVSDL